MKRLGLLTTGVALLLAPVGVSAATSELSERGSDDRRLPARRLEHPHALDGHRPGDAEPRNGADDDLRLEVIEPFRANTGLANNLQFWGANHYVFSNEERRIVKALINAFDADDELPTMTALVEELAITAERLRERLAFIARAGLLTVSSETDIGYELIDKYSSWGGPLRHNYHTITIGDGKPFDVW